MPKQAINEIRCTFLSRSENEALARSIISGFLLPLDPTVDELADIRCAISEAVTNCIVHGYRGTTGMIVLAAKSFDDRSVRITVIDHGCGIEDVRRAREPMFTTGEYGDRCGMGFLVMESFTDFLSVKSRLGKGTTVLMRKKLKP